MFNPLRSLFCPRVVPHKSSALSAATLHFLLVSGCALETRPGDGIAGDQFEVTIAPTVVYQVAQTDSGVKLDEVTGCKGPALAMFQQKVVPHFVKSCFECHDGTKSKAKLAVDMSKIKTDVVDACIWALYLGSKDPVREQAPIITSADPARPDKDHEFKYKDPAEFSAYRADVLSWLVLEKP
jgi:hypothetical protein